MAGSFTTCFVDIGGVLLTNGWDHNSRRHAAETFSLDIQEINERHGLTFDVYELGKISLDEYLSRVVFTKERVFTHYEFKSFMLTQSRPHAGMLRFLRELKSRHGLRVVAISNEGRELTLHRVRKYRLDELIDCFVVSSFVHLRKPDPEIFALAMDLAQATAEHSVYIEDRPMFVDVARRLGMHGIHHTNLARTRAALEELGLSSA